MSAAANGDKRYEKPCKIGLLIGIVLNGTFALWMYQAPWVARELRLALLTTLTDLTRF